MGKKKLVCRLSNYLYVPRRLVTQEMIDEYTYAVKQKEFSPLTGRTVKVDVTLRSYIRDLKNDQYKFFCGDHDKMEDVFGGLQAVDKRAAPRLGFQLALKRMYTDDDGQEKPVKIRPGQLQMLSEWLATKGGICKAGTQTGKTLGSWLIIKKMGLKTLILTAEVAPLLKFEADCRRFLNIDKLEERAGKKLLGFYDSKKPDQIYPLMLSTYAAMREAFKRRGFHKAIRRAYGLLWVDEVHELAAPTRLKVVNSLCVKYRGGVTATEERQDSAHPLVFDAVGPVCAHVEQEYMPMVMEVQPCNIGFNENVDEVETEVAYHAGVRQLVCQAAVDLLKRGRKGILIFVNRLPATVQYAEYLTTTYPELAGRVAAVNGGVKPILREKLLDEMNRGELDIMVGNQVLKQSMSFKRADTIIPVTPVTGSGPVTQLAGRVRTYAPDKQTPLIWYLGLEGHGRLIGALSQWKRFCNKKGFPVTYLNKVLEVEHARLLMGDECGVCTHFFECKAGAGRKAHREVCEEFEREVADEPGILDTLHAASELLKTSSDRRFVAMVRAGDVTSVTNVEAGRLMRLHRYVLNHPEVQVRPEVETLVE